MSEDLLAAFSRIAETAGKEILRHYHAGTTARLKSDRTPVTEADEAAEAIILPALAGILPGVACVAEEALMYLGRFVEQAPVDALFSDPRHPYTRALLSSVLTPEPGKGIPDVGLGESYPDPANIPPGCRFHPRCPLVIERCRSEAPDSIVRDGRLTECLLV